MRNDIRNFALGAILLPAITGAALAQTPAAPAAAPVTPVLATTLAPAKGDAKLTVTSTGFQDGGMLPAVYTGATGVSPPLSWSKGPVGTKSYVVLTEDSGTGRPQPNFHWVLYNVPASVTSLPQGVPADPKLASPAGAMNGINNRKASGYMGPSPPNGVSHPYHYEVFAVDQMIDVDPAVADRNTVVSKMTGHVLAEGEIVGNFVGVKK